MVVVDVSTKAMVEMEDVLSTTISINLIFHLFFLHLQPLILVFHVKSATGMATQSEYVMNEVTLPMLPPLLWIQLNQIVPLSILILGQHNI